MLRCVLRHRNITSVSSKSTYRINSSFSDQGYFEIRQALWAGLTERCTSLHDRVIKRSICSSTRDLPVDLSEANSEISETKKRKKVKHERRESEIPQKLTKNENEQTCKKKTHKKTHKKRSRKVTLSEELASDVLKNHKNEKHKDRAEGPPSLSFPFDGSSYTETDDEFSIYRHGSSDLYCVRDSSVIHMMDDCRSEGRFYQVSSASTSVFFPSVTTVLSNTVSRSQYYRLRNWKRNMIKEHGEVEFESIQQQTRDTGTHFHKMLEQKLFKLMLPYAISIKPQRHIAVHEKQSISSHHKLSSRAVDPVVNKQTSVAGIAPIELSERGLGDKIEAHEHADRKDSEYVKSVEHVLGQITSVLALESVVTHHELGYTGTFDCVAKYRGEVCLIDWKSSSRPKPTLKDCYDFPLQAVAYAGAVNHDDHYPFKVFSALIVVAYADGTPAHAHFLSHEQCQDYWSKWLERLQEYQTQFATDHSNVY